MHSIGSNLINDRLPVFKSITENLSKDKNTKNKGDFENFIEQNKGGFLEINIRRKNSQSTFSNLPNKGNKKCN